MERLLKNSRYLVRAALADDIEDLVRMRLSLQGHLESRNHELWRLTNKKISRLRGFYRRQIEDGFSRVLVVYDNFSGDLVGMGLGRKMVNEDYLPAGAGKIEDIWIEPGHRKKGLASRIVKDLLVFFKSQGVRTLSLDYVSGNREAEAFWGRLGFKPAIITAGAKIERVEESLRVTRTGEA